MEYIDNLPAMDLMRSEKMTFVQLIIPAESAHRAVSYLGDLGLLQFRDVKRCAEMSRKLRFFKDQIHKAGIVSSVHPVLQPDLELEELEIQLAEHEHELIEINHNSEKLRQTYNELLEFKMVLQKAGSFLVSSNSHLAEERELDDHVFSNDDYADTASLLEKEMRSGLPNQSGLRFVSGIISKSKVLRFERMLFRATRGNMLFNQAPADERILDPISTERVLSRLSELETTLDAGIRHRNMALSNIESQLAKWMNRVRREKAVYDTLNMLNFDVTKKCLVGEGWCPLFAKTQIQEALQRATLDSNSQVGIIIHAMDAVELPPTYIRTNRFTNAFQEIVDAYGALVHQVLAYRGCFT
ncbi:vacuolar proton ATPase A1 [Actinidia rufa]|uniref:V-type proton ATPase subunit a n=1 Tax=Actinidia rufa TaxID=165716 RepID=A0A7J0GQY1_9ERIC|nr:vacuolar proton ATPase A1 [Actinidia rufa]